jgi:hypothetical protein
MAESQEDVQSGNGEADGERRQTFRHALKLNKIFSAEIHRNGESLPCYLCIIDISEGGIRITSDYSFPKDESVPVHFKLDEPLDVNVKVIWSKMLEGGTNVYGMQFTDLNDTSNGQIKRVMEHYSPEFRRKNFKLNRVIYIEFLETNVAGRQYTFALDLNAKGMRVINEARFEPETVVKCRLYLDLDRPPVDVTGRVLSVKGATLDRFQMEFEFQDIGQPEIDRINEFLDRAASGELDRQNVRPQLDLDVRPDQPSVANGGSKDRWGQNQG